jgi:putative redox protein
MPNAFSGSDRKQAIPVIGFTSYVNGTRATVVKHMTSQPFRRIGKLEVVVTVPLPGDHPQRATLEKVALNRPVQQSLSPDLDIPVSFSWGDDL